MENLNPIEQLRLDLGLTQAHAGALAVPIMRDGKRIGKGVSQATWSQYERLADFDHVRAKQRVANGLWTPENDMTVDKLLELYIEMRKGSDQ